MQMQSLPVRELTLSESHRPRNNTAAILVDQGNQGDHPRNKN